MNDSEKDRIIKGLETRLSYKIFDLTYSEFDSTNSKSEFFDYFSTILSLVPSCAICLHRMSPITAVNNAYFINFKTRQKEESKVHAGIVCKNLDACEYRLSVKT